jgi:broad specificity phosphatase PhoE
MIYLVRHGQTIWNIEGKRQGSLDSPLTLMGVEQASQVSDILKAHIKNVNDMKFVSSPLARCKQFTSLICEHTNYEFSSVKFSDKLAECNFGRWEGLSEHQAKLQFTKVYESRQLDKWNHVIPGGESYKSFYDRVKKFLSEIGNEDCIVVAHEGTSKMIRGIVSNQPPSSILKTKHRQNHVYRIDDSDIELLSFE